MTAIEHIKNGMANLAQPISHGANLCFLAAIAELEKGNQIAGNIYKGESKAAARKLYNAYLSGRTKGFETGKRNALDLEAENKRQLQVIGEVAIERDKVQAENEQHRWIPVSERPPEAEDHPDSLGCSKNVLCYHYDLKACHAANISTRLWVDIYDHTYNTWMSGFQPTHWMPIILPDQALKGDKDV